MINFNLEKIGFSVDEADSIKELDLKYSGRIEQLVQSYMSGTREEPFVPYKENDDREEAYIKAQNFIKEVQAKLPEIDGNTARLVGWINCLPYLYESYINNGLEESLFYESAKDFTYKVRECKDVYGTLGMFTDWFFLFFDLKLFSMGRLQYEITTFMCDEYRVKDIELKKGDTVYYCHIPSSGRLNEELCMESFQKAYEFFKPYLNGNIIPIVSYTWLLYKPYTEGVFPEGSNLKKFTELFDIIKADSTGDFFEDAWRVFNKEYEGTVEGLPSDNTLRRNFIEYIKNGGDFGEGYGVILYNGETKEIINR